MSGDTVYHFGFCDNTFYGIFDKKSDRYYSLLSTTNLGCSTWGPYHYSDPDHGDGQTILDYSNSLAYSEMNIADRQGILPTYVDTTGAEYGSAIGVGSLNDALMWSLSSVEATWSGRTEVCDKVYDNVGNKFWTRSYHWTNTAFLYRKATPHDPQDYVDVSYPVVPAFNLNLNKVIRIKKF